MNTFCVSFILTHSRYTRHFVGLRITMELTSILLQLQMIVLDYLLLSTFYFYGLRGYPLFQFRNNLLHFCFSLNKNISAYFNRSCLTFCYFYSFWPIKGLSIIKYAFMVRFLKFSQDHYCFLAIYYSILCNDFIYSYRTIVCYV